MGVPYDVFTNAFLSKISEFDLLEINEADRTAIVDGYMKRAVSAFRHVCKYNLINSMNDSKREFSVEVSDGDLYELSEIISEGMIVQWLKPYLHKQEILENVLNTKDFSTYSPAELLLRVGDTYDRAAKNYTNMIREYSYNHGDLTDLHI